MSLSAAVGRTHLIPLFKHPRSLLFWLRSLVLVCVLPALAMTIWMIVAACHRERRAEEHGMLDTARALMQAVDRKLSSSVVGLQTLATSGRLAARDFAGFQRQAGEALPRLGGRNIVLVDPSGQELMNTFEAYGSPLPRIEHGGRQSVDAVFRSGKPVISDLFVGSLTHQPIIAIGVPVIRNDGVTYYLGMGISPGSLVDVLKLQNFPANWIAGIVDSTGTFVARIPNQERFVGKKTVPSLIRKIAEEHEGVLSGDTQDGISVVVGVSQSAVSGWTVGIGIPRAELMAPLYGSLRLTISASAALLLFALVIAWLIASHIARSIRALGEPALSLATDTPLLPPPLKIREVNEISGTLARASHLLKSRRAEREEAEQAALRESEERLRLALEGSRTGLFEWDRRTGTYVWNEGTYRLFGYQVGEVAPVRAAWQARVHPDDYEVALTMAERTMREQGDYLNEYRVIHPDGSVHWLRARGRFLYNAGEPIRLIGLVEDITEARQQIETQRLMVAELQHRTRNLMAVVHSIAYQTLRRADSLKDFEQRFHQRLQALSRAQGLLSRADNDAISLGALVGMELKAIGRESLQNRIRVSGPDVRLRKSAVEMLALAIHELATNALKYGALAGDKGRLSVTWQILGTAANREVVLEWIESGIAVAPVDPHRRGYGRELIEEALPYSLSARTKFELGVDELHCTIRFELRASGTDETARR